MTHALAPWEDVKAQSARTHAVICYVFILLSFFFGITSLIGLIWTYIAKNVAKGTFVESHFSISSMYFGLLLCGFAWLFL